MPAPQMMDRAEGILSIEIEGFRPFGKFQAELGDLEVIVGANGSGKSSLFEFLKFLRDGVYQELPPEILAGSIGQQIFHRRGPDRFSWRLVASLGQARPLAYSGTVLGPIGRTTITKETVETAKPLGSNPRPLVLMDIRTGRGLVYEREAHKLVEQSVELKRPNQLVLSTITNPKLVSLVGLREFIHGWRFYNSFNIANERIRESVVVEENPTLREDAGNLSAVLHYLMTEDRTVFDELQDVLKTGSAWFQGIDRQGPWRPGQGGCLLARERC